VSSLTSSSLCSHTMTCLLTHLIVIPDFFLESSHPSHPWLLTHITRVTTHPILSVLTHTHTHRTHPSHLTLSLPSLVLPCSLIPACSHITPTTTHSHECSHTECSHTHRHPWLLTPITCATMLTHPRLFSHHSYYHSHWVFSHPSSSLTTHSHHSSHPCSLIPAFSLTSLLWVLTPITCLLTLTISHRVSPHALSHPSHLCHHTEWSHITCVLRECLFPLPWCRTTTKSTLTLSSLSHTLPSISSLWTLPWCRTTTKSIHSLLWESVCSHSHSHGVVLPPSHHSHPHQSLCSHSHSHGVVLPPSHHSLLWENLCSHSHFHGVVLPPSLPTHCSERTCAPTHTPMVSYHYKCITNHLPHSPTHHASITSSSPHHLFLSPTTTNRFLSLHTTLLTPPFHSQPSQSSPKSSPISIHTHNDNSRTP